MESDGIQICVGWPHSSPHRYTVLAVSLDLFTICNVDSLQMC